MIPMSSDDEDESLSQFLEAEDLYEISDQENIVEREEDDTLGKSLRRENSKLSVEEEKERQEAKKIRIEEGEIRDEGLSRALRSSSSSSLSSLDLEAEIETALSPKKDVIITCNNNNEERLGPANRQFSRRIETGLFSQVPPELVFHILKFLSSEDLVSCSLVCRFLNFAAADESMWRRLLVSFLFP